MHHNVLGDVGMYVPYVPSSEEERKQCSQEQGSQTMHTSMVHVEKKWDSPAEEGGRRKRQHL